MNLNKELLARIEDMSQAEQELLLASLTAKNGNEILGDPLMKKLKWYGEVDEIKDNLVALALCALDLQVEPKTVFDGTFPLFSFLCELKSNK